MNKRSYKQYCALARGLDVIGERWSLLLIRELMSGPKRYKDLGIGLKGMGPNLLSKRLQELEQAGVIERAQLSPPAASMVYQLTDMGWELKQVINPLIRWGFHFLGQKQPDELSRLEWDLVALQALFNAEKADGIEITAQFDLGVTEFYIVIANQEARTQLGRLENPDIQVKSNTNTLDAVFRNSAMLDVAIEEKTLEVVGDSVVLKKLIQLFKIPS